MGSDQATMNPYEGFVTVWPSKLFSGENVEEYVLNMSFYFLMLYQRNNNILINDTVMLQLN